MQKDLLERNEFLLKIIDKSDAEADLNLDPNDLYINFNYTNTLQRLYNIPDKCILHIHGALKNLNGADILWKDVFPKVSTIEEIEDLGPLVEGDKWSNEYIRGEIQFGATGITPEEVNRDLTLQYEKDEFYDTSRVSAINKLVDFVDKSTKNR